MGLLDKIRDVRENVEDALDRTKTRKEIEASESRIQRERKLRKKEAAGQISEELAEKRRERIKSDYEREKKPLSEKIISRAEASAKEFLTPPKKGSGKRRQVTPNLLWGGPLSTGKRGRKKKSKGGNGGGEQFGFGGHGSRDLFW